MHEGVAFVENNFGELVQVDLNFKKIRFFDKE
jgi:hypothetical protein